MAAEKLFSRLSNHGKPALNFFKEDEYGNRV
jgi:hypothetical protein